MNTTDTRSIEIKRVKAGSYIVTLDGVAIKDATINKTRTGWEITSIPGDDIHMPFRTLKDAKAHMLSWFTHTHVPALNAAHAEALSNHAPIRRVGVIVAPAEVQIPAMLSEYGYTAHGNTYAVDYNRIHESVKSEFRSAKTAETTPIDSLKIAIKAMEPMRTEAWKSFTTARNAQTPDTDAIDLAYQVWEDFDKAISGMRQTLAMFTGHDCDFNLMEIGMSDCQYGCKIYRCSKCSDGEKVLHNATYGCKG